MRWINGIYPQTAVERCEQNELPRAVVETNFFVLSGTAAFFTWIFFRALYHEPYRDESGILLNALYNASLHDLTSSLSHGGHPYLYPLLAWFLARVIPAYVALEMFSVLISTVTVWLILARSPFSKGERVLLGFGYFLSYEYALFTRPYVLVPFFSFIFCHLVRSRPQSYILQALSLVGLMSTTAYGAVLTIAFGLSTALTICRTELSFQNRRLLAPLGIFCAGLASVSAQMIPPTAGGYADGYFFYFDKWRLIGVLSGIWKGLVPLPTVSVAFWGTNFLDDWPKTMAIFGALAMLFCGQYIFTVLGKTAFYAFLLSWCGLLAFAYIKFPGSLRHHGHYVIALLMVLWIWWPRGTPTTGTRRPFTVLLLVHACAALFASIQDLTYPFSSGREAAEILRHSPFNTCLLVAEPAPPATTVSLALGRPMYYAGAERDGTFLIWDTPYEPISDSLLLDRVERKRAGRCAVIITNRQLMAGPEYQLFGVTEPAIMKDEAYFLYGVR